MKILKIYIHKSCHILPTLSHPPICTVVKEFYKTVCLLSRKRTSYSHITSRAITHALFELHLQALSPSIMKKKMSGCQERLDYCLCRHAEVDTSRSKASFQPEDRRDGAKGQQTAPRLPAGSLGHNQSKEKEPALLITSCGCTTC